MLRKYSDIENEPIFSVFTSPNSTDITELVLNSNTSIIYVYTYTCMLFAMTSKVRKKRKIFKINWKGGIFKKTSEKQEIFRFIGILGTSAITCFSHCSRKALPSSWFVPFAIKKVANAMHNLCLRSGAEEI